MPTIPIEESDYGAGSGALSGERVFKNADPATTVREQTENPVWHGLRAIVKQESISADLTAANYAADLAAGFPNLSKAVRRAARRMRSENITVLTLNSGSVTFPTPPDIFTYILTDDGGGPYGEDSVANPSPTSPSQNNGRLILVINRTVNHKLVGNSSSHAYARLAPQEGCLFYGFDDSGSGTTLWKPVGRQIDFWNFGPKSFPLLLVSQAHPADLNSGFDMSYQLNRDDRTVTISCPEIALITAAGSTSEIQLKHANGGDLLFPIGTRGYSGYRSFPVVGAIDTVREIFMMGFSTPGYLSINRLNAVFGASVTIEMPGFEITYLCQ